MACPIQILNKDGEHSFTLNEEALTKLMLQEDVKDRSVVIISVAGAFRKGKSFMLDFFLRYLTSKYVLKETGNKWLGDEKSSLKGFSWRGGSERETTGILLWSEIFLTQLANGEKLAILLMDTQGTFDSESTMKDCAMVFALSTMISSVQIYNLSQNIQEDDLQHLQLFTEYGRLALADSGKTPFQRLHFLVRDWSSPYEAAYGAEGGQQILDRRLQLSERQHPELQSLRKRIKSCFSKIACYLMPHPGLEVTNHTFDGRLSDITTSFKENLLNLVPMLLAPQNLVPKEIDGQKIKARDVVQYFKSYVDLYKGDDLPVPKSVFVATAEANNLTAVAEATEYYNSLMGTECRGTQSYLQEEQLEANHLRIRDQAIGVFQAKRKMGGEEFSKVYKEQLIKDLEASFNQFKLHNERARSKATSTMMPSLPSPHTQTGQAVYSGLVITVAIGTVLAAPVAAPLAALAIAGTIGVNISIRFMGFWRK